MEQYPELSVIIPVYNIQNQLKICLDSVINQSYKNMEIIVIDDSSTDNSPHIIKNYAKKCQQLKPVFFEKNTGVGNVRNYGINMSKGRYIGFIDGDDWIDTEFYQRLLLTIKRDKSDIVACGIKTEYDNSKSCELRYKYDFSNCISGNFALKLLTKSENYGYFITPIVNNKIYVSEYIKSKKIIFNNNRSFQDDYFSFFAILYARKISLVTDTYYHYYQRVNSITHTFSKRLVNDCFNTLVQIYNDLEKQKILTYYEKEYYAYVERLLTSLLDMLVRKEQDNFIQKEYLKYIITKFSKQFEIGKIIDYIDNKRIFKFFDL